MRADHAIRWSLEEERCPPAPAPGGGTAAAAAAPDAEFESDVLRSSGAVDAACRVEHCGGKLEDFPPREVNRHGVEHPFCNSSKFLGSFVR